jgi:hypothetical protein
MPASLALAANVGIAPRKSVLKSMGKMSRSTVKNDVRTEQEAVGYLFIFYAPQRMTTTAAPGV